MYIAILGRQPALGVGELEHLYGPDSVHWFSDQSATISSSHFSLDTLGGTQKAGRIILELSHADWRRASMKIVQTYAKEWATKTGKITLGISAYGFEESSRDIQKTGIILKQKLKNSGVSLRLIPNTEAALSSATSHHNKLGSAPNKIELLVLRARNGRVIIAESIGTQNITAYALRDQKRPKRDAFVGMLPPKLAQIMINLASPSAFPVSSLAHSSSQVASRREEDTSLAPAHHRAADTYSEEQSSESTLPDRNHLQSNSPASASRHSALTANKHLQSELEAASEQVTSDEILTTRDNLQPERDKAPGPLFASGAKPVSSGSESSRDQENAPRLLDPFCGTGVVLQEAALMGYRVYGTDLAVKMIEFSEVNLKWLADSHNITVNAKLHQGDAMEARWQRPIDSVVCESYLGQPFSAPPSPAKLMQVKDNCNHIISAFLKNIGSQIAPGTPLCVAVPAWRNFQGEFTHLPLAHQLERLGFTQYKFNNIKPEDLLYYREDQIVARELLVLVKS